MAYIKKIWQDYPDTTTPIIAADMNNIENGIEAVDNVTKYITATAASNGDFEDAVKKVFGPSFNQEFNISNFKYKDKIYSTSGNDLESIESTKCETNIVTKNFSFSPSEIGIELGIKKEGKLYTIDNKLVGEFSDEAKMYELLDSSTAYNYKYEFEGSNPYLIKVTPLIKIRGLE